MNALYVIAWLVMLLGCGGLIYLAATGNGWGCE